MRNEIMLFFIFQIIKCVVYYKFMMKEIINRSTALYLLFSIILFTILLFLIVIYRFPVLLILSHFGFPDNMIGLLIIFAYICIMIFVDYRTLPVMIDWIGKIRVRKIFFVNFILVMIMVALSFLDIF